MTRKREEEITGRDSPPRRENLRQMAIYNLSCMRNSLPEKFFNDELAPTLGMRKKMLMPLDAELEYLIHSMEKGLYDALQKKYLKTLLFCICEKDEGQTIEEYAFSFSYPNTSTADVMLNMSCTRSEKISTTSNSNAAEVTPDPMRNCAYKMTEALVSLMKTLASMPEERTILMKLLYYDDVTPDDYKPPFAKFCDDNEDKDIWNKNPLNMTMGNVNTKHLVLSLKVKTISEPCKDNNTNSGDDGMGVDNESDQDDNFSDTEIADLETSHAKKKVMQNVLPGLNQINRGDLIYMKALYHSLSMDYVTVAKLQGKLDGEANQYMVRKLIGKMVREGYVKNSSNRRLGN